MKRIIAASVLILLAGSLVAIFLYPLLPGIRIHAFRIAAWLYLLLAFVELLYISDRNLHLFSKATARLEGGWSLRISLALAQSQRGTHKRLARYVSIGAATLAQALAWPSSRIPRLVLKDSIKAGLNDASHNTLGRALLDDTGVLCWQAGVMLFVSLATYTAIVFVRPQSPSASDLMFGIVLSYANLFLLSAAVAPRGMAERLRQQPLNPRLQLVLLFLFLGGILILGFVGITYKSDPAELNVIISAFTGVFRTADVWDVASRETWSPVDVWMTASSALFSIVCVQLLAKWQDLRRNDNDVLMIAANYLAINDPKSSLRWLSHVKTDTKESLVIRAVAHYCLGDATKGNHCVGQAALHQTLDWPRRPTDSEITWLGTGMLVNSRVMPSGHIENILETFLSSSPRPIACLVIAETLFLTGRMSWAQIFKLFDDIPDTQREILLRPYLLFALQRYSAARDAIHSTRDEELRRSETCVLCILRLLVALASSPSEDIKRKSVHEWCIRYVTECQMAVAAAIKETDILGTISVKAFLDVVEPALKRYAPEDAKVIEENSRRCTAFLNQWELGRAAISVMPIARSEASAMPQQGGW